LRRRSTATNTPEGPSGPEGVRARCDAFRARLAPLARGIALGRGTRRPLFRQPGEKRPASRSLRSAASSPLHNGPYPKDGAGVVIIDEAGHRAVCGPRTVRRRTRCVKPLGSRPFFGPPFHLVEPARPDNSAADGIPSALSAAPVFPARCPPPRRQSPTAVLMARVAKSSNERARGGAASPIAKPGRAAWDRREDLRKSRPTLLPRPCSRNAAGQPDPSHADLLASQHLITSRRLWPPPSAIAGTQPSARMAVALCSRDVQVAFATGAARADAGPCPNVFRSAGLARFVPRHPTAESLYPGAFPLAVRSRAFSRCVPRNAGVHLVCRLAVRSACEPAHARARWSRVKLNPRGPRPTPTSAVKAIAGTTVAASRPIRRRPEPSGPGGPGTSVRRADSRHLDARRRPALTILRNRVGCAVRVRKTTSWRG